EFSNCEDFYKEIERIGTTPLPPYIREKLKDKSRYQTIYAKNPGSVAAPTAGLHFTKDLMDKLKKKGINFGFLTLHVSLGTFAPVRVENIEDHIMHSEIFTLPEETANTINETRSLGKKVIAVGTTSCRTLEATALEFGLPIKTNLNSTTNIFIKPGFKFSVVDSLITNFHLPKSTLVMLVCAFADKKLIKSAYEKAIKNKMKFFSFGDAMLII
ncbi:MAG: tRNA preQ1(34) S-adenosylmethionine ribosyltransferase-isomerase QueA, partial [Firmicutes bacterium]|nr:tRNA preQ1(34) S-adenosylmethionine ribosyltransferase-isomerase QueA [Bacillota bacterium]